MRRVTTPPPNTDSLGARALGALLTAGIVFGVANLVENSLDADPSEYLWWNVAGALLLGLLVLAGPTWVAAGGSVLSAGGAIVALSLSSASLQQSEANADRLQQQDQRRYADRIYIGEPPVSVYGDLSNPLTRARCDARPAGVPGCHPTNRDQNIWFVVINASGAQAQDVWVADSEGRVVAIHGLERCSMYAMPYELPTEAAAPGPYRPAVLYFSDPSGHWRRPMGGALESLSRDEFNRELVAARIDDDDGDSAWTDILPDCAG